MKSNKLQKLECFMQRREPAKSQILQSELSEVKKHTESGQARQGKKSSQIRQRRTFRKTMTKHRERNVKLSRCRDAIFCVSKRFYFQRSVHANSELAPPIMNPPEADFQTAIGGL